MSYTKSPHLLHWDRNLGRTRIRFWPLPISCIQPSLHGPICLSVYLSVYLPIHPSVMLCVKEMDYWRMAHTLNRIALIRMVHGRSPPNTNSNQALQYDICCIIWYKRIYIYIYIYILCVCVYMCVCVCVCVWIMACNLLHLTLAFDAYQRKIIKFWSGLISAFWWTLK